MATYGTISRFIVTTVAYWELVTGEEKLLGLVVGVG